MLNKNNKNTVESPVKVLGKYHPHVMAFMVTISSLVFSGCSTTPQNMIHYPYDQQEGKNINNYSKNNQLSITLAGENEFQYFVDFFALNTNEEMENKVKEIQTKHDIKVDGIIGKQTLHIIYQYYYAKNKEKLSHDVRQRVEIFEELYGYSKEDFPYSKISIPNSFNNTSYYGNGLGENVPGTYINQKLFDKGFAEKKEIIQGNQIVLEQLEDRFVVSAYVDGELKVLSYASPGGIHFDKNRGEKRMYPTPKGSYTIRKTHKYHISSSYPKNGGFGPDGGATMPYAINFRDNSFWFHAGYTTGKRQSHGCVRLPILYIKGLYDLVRKEGIETFTIDIRDN